MSSITLPFMVHDTINMLFLLITMNGISLAAYPFANIPKIVKAYRSLLQELNQHLVLIVAPTGYVKTLRFHRDYFVYWKSFEPYVLQLIQKIISDVHI